MSSTVYHCVEHVVPCQHIRQYPRGTAGDQETRLHLAVKQYTPIDHAIPQPGDVTIIGAHANGFVKELYEPLWDELYHYGKATGAFRIRNIWFADSSNQGASGVINEGQLGNDRNYPTSPHRGSPELTRLQHRGTTTPETCYRWSTISILR